MKNINTDNTCYLTYFLARLYIIFIFSFVLQNRAEKMQKESDSTESKEPILNTDSRGQPSSVIIQ